MYFFLFLITFCSINAISLAQCSEPLVKPINSPFSQEQLAQLLGVDSLTINAYAKDGMMADLIAGTFNDGTVFLVRGQRGSIDTNFGRLQNPRHQLPPGWIKKGLALIYAIDPSFTLSGIGLERDLDPAKFSVVLQLNKDTEIVKKKFVFMVDGKSPIPLPMESSKSEDTANPPARVTLKFPFNRMELNRAGIGNISITHSITDTQNYPVFAGVMDDNRSLFLIRAYPIGQIDIFFGIARNDSQTLPTGWSRPFGGLVYKVAAPAWGEVLNLFNDPSGKIGITLRINKNGQSTTETFLFDLNGTTPR